MSTIRIESEVKKELEELMFKELQKEINNPKNFIIALRSKYGYTHSEFIMLLMRSYKKR